MCKEKGPREVRLLPCEPSSCFAGCLYFRLGQAGQLSLGWHGVGPQGRASARSVIEMSTSSVRNR